MLALKNRLNCLLRWSEKYTKTDMVYLASGSFWSIIAQVITAFLIFGFAILVARYLPKEAYGQYKYIIATVALLSSFSLTGLGTAIFQSVARGYEGELLEGFWLNLRWSALVFLGAFMLAAYYFLQGNSTLAFGVLIGGSLSPFLTSANLSSVFLNAKKDFRRSSVYFSIIENIVAIGALAITVLFTKSPLILAIVYFSGNTLATYLIYRRVVQLYKPDPTKTDPEMLTYGKHLSLMGILNGIAGNIDQILLFHFVGPAQLAIYNFATAIPDQTKGPLKMLDTMVQAKFVNRSNKEISAGMKSKMFWLAVSSTIFIAFYIFLAPYFYGIFFPNYAEATFYSQLYAISLLSSVFSPANSYLSAKKKVREQYITSTTNSLFQITAMFICVFYWGLLGLIIARVLTRVFYGIASYILYFQEIRTHAIC